MARARKSFGLSWRRPGASFRRFLFPPTTTLAWHLFSIGIVLLDTQTSSAGIVLGRAKPPSDASTLRLFIHTDFRQSSYEFHDTVFQPLKSHRYRPICGEYLESPFAYGAFSGVF